MSETTRKPSIWKRWWVWAIIIAALAVTGRGTTADAPDQTPDTAASATTDAENHDASQAQKNPEPEPASSRDRFAAAFAAAYGSEISDMVDFDPQDRDSGHYRTEFRLGAYDASEGTHGVIGDMTIDMVAYGGYGNPDKNTDFRIYLTGPKTSVVAAYPALAKAMDPTLTDEDIDAVLAKFEEAHISSLAGELSFAVSATAVRADTLSSIGESAEAYIDIDTKKLPE